MSIYLRNKRPNSTSEDKLWQLQVKKTNSCSIN
jgi:hypothetical protein